MYLNHSVKIYTDEFHQNKNNIYIWKTNWTWLKKDRKARWEKSMNKININKNWHIKTPWIKKTAENKNKKTKKQKNKKANKNKSCALPSTIATKLLWKQDFFTALKQLRQKQYLSEQLTSSCKNAVWNRSGHVTCLWTLSHSSLT